MQMSSNLCSSCSIIVRTVYIGWPVNRRGTFGDHSAVAWSPVIYGPFWVWRPVALWSLQEVCVTVLVLASSFSHPGSLTNTHTSWQLSPCPCGSFFFSFAKAKGIQVFTSHTLWPACRWLLWPMMGRSSGWEGGKEGTENLTRSLLVLGMRVGKGWGQGYWAQDDQPFISACSCQILSSSLWLSSGTTYSPL